MGVESCIAVHSMLGMWVTESRRFYFALTENMQVVLINLHWQKPKGYEKLQITLD